MTNYFADEAQVANSLELRFLVDRLIAARRAGQLAVANIYAFAAEGLLKVALPKHASVIAAVASRKGVGREIAATLAQQLSPAMAAAVLVIWNFRGARQTATETLSAAFQHDDVFNATIRMLCRRLFEPVTFKTSAPTTSIEVASPHGVR